METKYYLAVDIGASSGRHILGHIEDGRIILEEIHRFENRQVQKNGHDCWDIEHLWKGILDGLRACKSAGKIPETMGIDTWGVDYVMIDRDGKPCCDPVAYRDKRNLGIPEELEHIIPFEELYARTGIQKLPFNTIYQLYAQKKEMPDSLSENGPADRLLMIPDYFHYLLTGRAYNEYTIASTSGLLDARKCDWDRELLDMIGLPQRPFRDLAMPGTVVGPFSEEIRNQVGFSCNVVLPASHDTASAYLAVPAEDDNAIYLSSGTWSLLGVENKEPITTPESCRANFTNEGGAWKRYRYIKNIMGLWMIQSVRRELNGDSYVAGKVMQKLSEKKWSFPDLIAEAQKNADTKILVDVDRPCFLSPDSMIGAIREECGRTGQPIPESVGKIMQTIYFSLTHSYKQNIETLTKLTGKKYTRIHIVGGGCQDQYLNRMTAQACGLPVMAGPVEGTAIGNLTVQMIAAGEFAGLKEARASVRKSFPLTEYQG